MDFFKRLTSAIFLAIVIAVPVIFLESLIFHHIIQIYKIPYLLNFTYLNILGCCFICMLIRNKIKMKEKDQGMKDFFKELFEYTTNRAFKIIFVWCVALTINFFLSI